MSLDWSRLKAVVLQSDDWGLCAWSPDPDAHRALADSPAFRTPAGRRYGGSTLEGAADVDALAALLAEFRGGDGFAPVLQANTILAAPDYARLIAPGFGVTALPLIHLPATPARWARPGFWERIGAARAAGVWWPELHGLHHLPATAWLDALRRGAPDARRAHEQQSPVCAAVTASSEYDPREPRALRASNFDEAVTRFQSLFGRLPGSVCPPDYRWNDEFEADAERLGVATIQGKAEQHGPPLARLRRWYHRARWPRGSVGRYYLPARIAFEPVDPARGGPSAAVTTAVAAARAAWRRGQPAIISMHRVNVVHLDPGSAAAGRSALRDLLAAFAADHATFLVDREVRDLDRRGWSLREIGSHAAVLRRYGVTHEPLRFAAPAGVRGVTIGRGRGDADAAVSVEGGEVTARMSGGAYRLEWVR